MSEYNDCCIICQILCDPSDEEQSLRVIKGDHWYATLRLDQEYLGTVYVTARRHVASLPQLTGAEEREFIEIRNRLITAQMQGFGASVVNVSCLMNLAFDEDGVGSPHVHYHFKPRYAAPVEKFGHTFVDRQFGAYIKDKHPNVVDVETAKQIVAALQQVS